MSTYWGYKCIDCMMQSDTPWNQGEQTLSDLYWSWERWKALEESPIALDAKFDLKLSYSADVITFLRDHYGHSMVLYNEYGQVGPILFPTMMIKRPTITKEQIEDFSRRVLEVLKKFDEMLEKEVPRQ